MESNQNTSSINVSFGEYSEAKPQIYMKVNINFNQAQANAQIDKLQSSTQASDLHGAFVIFFKSSLENKVKLVEHIKAIFENQMGAMISRRIAKSVESEIISYSVSETDNGVKLIIKPGAQVLQPIEEQIEAFLAMGLGDIVEKQTNSLTLSFATNQTFPEITKDLTEETYTFILSLLKSFKAQLILNLNQNIITAVFQLLKGLGLNAEETPFGALQLFKNLEIDLKFSSTEELPSFIRSTHLQHEILSDGFGISYDAPPKDRELLIKLTEYIDNGIDIYATLKNIGAVHIELNGAGFADHFIFRVRD